MCADHASNYWTGAQAGSAMPRDLLFRAPRKKGKIKFVDPPTPPLEAPVADTHAHLSMIDAPLALARCAAHGVGYVVCMAEVGEDADELYQSLAHVQEQAAELIDELAPGCALPRLGLVVGCHPHNAKDYDEALESTLFTLAADPRTVALGEIGLDYHYDLSPRATQRAVFARQIQVAEQLGLPIVLHLREAHDDALTLLERSGYPLSRALLHCCTLGAEELAPWVEAGCTIAYGGAFTFSSAASVREAAASVPLDRLVTETDAPYMAPVPLRGATCLPDYVIFTAAALAREFGFDAGTARARFLERLYNNALRFFDPLPEGHATSGQASREHAARLHDSSPAGSA